MNIKRTGKRSAAIAMFLALALTVNSTSAQKLTDYTAQQTTTRLMRLEQGKKLLYVSFLPGAENTRLLVKARQESHFNTAVFWMTRGEGMHNYNGPEKGIDLGVIHVAEMENAAKRAGYTPFVSSCEDLGARDTAAINATLPTDRLVLDLAAVIGQFRPDILIIGHDGITDSIQAKTDQLAKADFNDWMDSICQLASQLAADPQRAGNTSSGSFDVKWILADKTGTKQTLAGATPSGASQQVSSIAVNLGGMDPVSGKSYQGVSLESKLAFRSIYPDLDNIPINGDTAWLYALHPNASAQSDITNETVTNLFSTGGTALPTTRPEPTFGVWSRLAKKGLPVETIQAQLSGLQGLLQRQNNHEDQDNQQSQNYHTIIGTLKSISALLPLKQGAAEKTMDPDINWVQDQIMELRKEVAGVDLKATSDQELGVLGQNFRLRLVFKQNASLDSSAEVLWIKAPGLIDTALSFNRTLSQTINQNSQGALLLDSSLHIALMQEAYQPFWLNKSLRSDGSYNIDPAMQGRLSDTTSYHVEAQVATAADTLNYILPVYYRHFDRMEGQIRRPFYTIEPVLVALTPTVLLTHVLRDDQVIGQKEIHVNMKTLFKDTAQVVLFKFRQVGIEATINGHKIQSDSASLIYQDAGYITPAPGAKTKVGIVINSAMINKFNPLTPIIKPSVLLKLPEGVQSFSSNIKTIGYPYQSPRIYNYHSQTLVVGDTIHTSGRHLLYLNGLSGDVFENAFNQLGYKVQSGDLNDFASWVMEVDLTSEEIPSFVQDSLKRLDAIVLCANNAALPTDSVQLARLHYLLNAYVRMGGRLINMDPDPCLQQYLPVADSVYTSMLIAGSFRGKSEIDSVGAILNAPNKIPAKFITKWQGILSRASIEAPAGNDSTIYPVRIARQDSFHDDLAPMDVHYLDKGIQVNCFLELGAPLSDGKPDAYKLLANILAFSAPQSGKDSRQGK